MSSSSISVHPHHHEVNDLWFLACVVSESSTAPSTSSSFFHPPSSSSTSMNSDKEEEESDEDCITVATSSPSSSNSRGSLYEQKIRHVVIKIVKLIFTTPTLLDLVPLSPSSDTKTHEAIELEAYRAITALPEIKVMKKTINQSTVAVTLFVLQKLNPATTCTLNLTEVIQALQLMDGTPSLSRSIKLSNRSHHDLNGVTSLLTALQHHTSMAAILASTTSSSSINDGDEENVEGEGGEGEDQLAGHRRLPSQDCLGTAVAISQELGCPERVERMACDLVQMHTTLGVNSRHPTTVAASCVLLAARRTSHKITYKGICKASGISPQTIRRSVYALEALLLVHKK